MKFEAEFYETENKDIPVKDFIDNLDKKMQAKVLKTINLLCEKGNLLRLPYSEHIEDGIFELRTKVGSDISRVMYFFYYEGKIILTNGFIKKTQKTPKNEIEKAKQYRTDYISRR